MQKWSPEQKAKACEEILAQVAKGRSLIGVCTTGDDWIPAESVFRLWCDQDADLAARYAQAREVRADVIFEEILDIADNAKNDWMERQGEGDAGWAANGEHVQRSRLRVDARKWMLGKMNQKKYGDRSVVEGPGPNGEHTLKTPDMTPQELARHVAFALARGDQQEDK